MIAWSHKLVFKVLTNKVVQTARFITVTDQHELLFIFSKNSIEIRNTNKLESINTLFFPFYIF